LLYAASDINVNFVTHAAVDVDFGKEVIDIAGSLFLPIKLGRICEAG
jgi:hypothetical protein